MKFLVDNQLPIALSRLLKTQALVSYQVVKVHLDEATDKEIWEYATWCCPRYLR